MSSFVHRTIHGQPVSARPVYKGGSTPAYWMATVNNHTLARTFGSAAALFNFVRGKLNTRNA